MNKTVIKAEIVADSLSPQGDRLTSLLITFPRIILAEINTHRMLSKNTSSSRAIPFKKMVESVKNDPFIPIAWQKHHSGMQGSEYISSPDDIWMAETNWKRTRDFAVDYATLIYHKIGVTKQLANRLLEPFMWTTMLITGSKEGWDNFFELRNPSYEHPYKGKRFKSKKEFIEYDKWVLETTNDTNLGYNAETEDHWRIINKGQAEIHLMDLAEKIYDAVNESTPKQLVAGEWHIPMFDKINQIELSKLEDSLNHTDSNPWELPIKIATALAARTSYTVVGDEKEINYERLIGLHDRLIEMRHDSPLEHCARAMTEQEYNNFIRGSLTHSSNHPNSHIFADYPDESKGWCRNFKGFIQYRHIIETM